MVVIGGSLALTMQMGLAVGAGTLLTFFPVHWKDLIVGVLFSAARPICSSCRSPRRKRKVDDRRRRKSRDAWKEITTAFIVIFIGEFGDLTQIQAANLEAKLHQPLESSSRRRSPSSRSPSSAPTAVAHSSASSHSSGFDWAAV